MEPDYLYRYTQIQYMQEILKNQCLYLTEPAGWRDRSDAAQMEQYRTMHGKHYIRACCLSEVGDSLFHWETVSRTPPLVERGCVIQFYVPELKPALEGFLFEKVQYKKFVDLAREVKRHAVSVKKLPFLKRYPYRTEQEWRIVRLGDADPGLLKALSFKKRAFSSITISQDVSVEDFTQLKSDLLARGLSSSQIHHSTLNDSARWLKLLQIPQK